MRPTGHSSFRTRSWFLAALLCTLPLVAEEKPAPPPPVPAPAAEKTSLQIPVQEFRLKNGMLFLVVERHTSPQIACHIALRAGSALEEPGKTGIAHILEHMLFKGTKNFGTTDWKKDQELQEKIEAAYQAILAEEKKPEPNQALITEKQKDMDALRQETLKIYIPQAFSTHLSANGAQGINAFTNTDQTHFHLSVPSDMLELWASMASEQIFEPVFREFYVEKSVVGEEWAMRYVNSPMGASWLDLCAVAFKTHPYKNPVIGLEEDIRKFNTTDAAAFHKKWYNPTNAVCVLVGDLTLAQAKKIATTYFERYPAGTRSPETFGTEAPQTEPRKSVRTLKGAKTPILHIAFHGAKLTEKDSYALDAIGEILSSGRSARLEQRLVQKGLAMRADAVNDDFHDNTLFILTGIPVEPESLKGNKDVTDAEREAADKDSCEKLEVLLLAELEKLKTEPVSAEELQRVRKACRRDFLDQLQDNEEMASSLASSEVTSSWQRLTGYLDTFDTLTPADLQAAAQRYFKPENRSSAWILPGKGVPSSAQPFQENHGEGSGQELDIDPAAIQENHSIYPTPEGWKNPLSITRKPIKAVYSKADEADLCGAKLFLLKDNELPIINLAIFVKAGSIDLPESATGLTDLLNATLIAGGTEGKTPDELAEAIDRDAIRVSFQAQEEMTVIRLSVLREDWTTGLNLLSEILTTPRFDPTILEQAGKNRLLTQLRRQSDNPGGVARREALRLHFAGHPYGRDPLQALETLPKLTAAELKAYLKTRIIPANMTLALSGDFDPTQTVMQDALKRFLEKLPQGKATERAIATPGETPPCCALIQKAGQVQSQVHILLPSVTRTDPNYWKIAALMELAGGGDSLLYKRIRDDLGLAYAVWAGQVYKWQAGYIDTYIGAQGANTARAIEETLSLYTALGKTVPAKEFERKRLDMLNGFIFTADTPAKLLDLYAQYHLRGEPLNTLDLIQEAFIKVTPEEASALAKKYLDPQKAQIVIVGDKSIEATGKAAADDKKNTLEECLNALATQWRLPYLELPLR